jgi:hypothetical protein
MRVALGKPENLIDLSILGKKAISELEKSEGTPEDLGIQAFEDATDLKNEEFIYIL